MFIRSSHPFWEGAVSVRRFRKLGTRVDDRIIGISIDNDTTDSSTNTVDIDEASKLAVDVTGMKFWIGKVIVLVR